MAPMGIYDGGKADPKHRRHQTCEVRVRRPDGNPFTPSMPVLPGMPIPVGVDNYSYCIKGSASPSTSLNRNLTQTNASDSNGPGDGPHSNTRDKRVRKKTRKAEEAAAAARGGRKRSLSPSSSSSACSPPPKKQKPDSRPPPMLKLRNPDFVKRKHSGYEGWKLQQQAFREAKAKREAEAQKAWLEKSAPESEDDDDELVVDTPLQGFAQPVSGHGGDVGDETESDGESTEPDEETIREENEAAHLLLALQYRQEQERLEAARALTSLRYGSEQERQRREEAAQGLMRLHYGSAHVSDLDEVNGASQTPSDMRSTLHR